MFSVWNILNLLGYFLYFRIFLTHLMFRYIVSGIFRYFWHLSFLTEHFWHLCHFWQNIYRLCHFWHYNFPILYITLSRDWISIFDIFEILHYFIISAVNFVHFFQKIFLRFHYFLIQLLSLIAFLIPISRNHFPEIFNASPVKPYSS